MGAAVGSARAEGGGGCRNSFGIVEHSRGSGNGRGFYARDGIQSDTEFDHAIAGVAGAVGLVESVQDSSDKGGGVFVVVLATHIGQKHEFHNACVYMLTSGDAGRETGICHGN